MSFLAAFFFWSMAFSACLRAWLSSWDAFDFASASLAWASAIDCCAWSADCAALAWAAWAWLFASLALAWACLAWALAFLMLAWAFFAFLLVALLTASWSCLAVFGVL